VITFFIGLLVALRRFLDQRPDLIGGRGQVVLLDQFADQQAQRHPRQRRVTKHFRAQLFCRGFDST
jgi:hypothetical protein